MNEYDAINEYDDMIEKFKSYTETHPNIANMWIDYLEIMKNKHNKIMTQSNYTLSLLSEKIPDVDLNNILLLTAFMKSIPKE